MLIVKLRQRAANPADKGSFHFPLMILSVFGVIGNLLMKEKHPNENVGDISRQRQRK